MLNLKYESFVDFSRWSRLLFKHICIAVIMAVIVELLIVVHKIMTGEPIFLSEYLLLYILTPTLCNVLILLLVNLFLKHYITKKDAGMQAVICITAAVCASLVHVSTHYTVSSIYAIFCLPIIISLIYIDIKPILFAYILTIISYLTFAILVVPKIDESGKVHGFNEIITMMAILTIVLLIASLILQILSVLTKGFIDKSEAAKRDSFTKLLNHATFYDKLDSWIKFSEKKELPFSVIVYDVDDFKYINDKYGHDIGDIVLLRFANVISDMIEQGDLGFRYGGEEFVILTWKNQEETVTFAKAVKNRFTEVCASMSLIEDETITASAGTCTYLPGLFKSKLEFFTSADKALYNAKESPGKNRVVSWRHDMD